MFTAILVYHFKNIWVHAFAPPLLRFDFRLIGCCIDIERDNHTDRYTVAIWSFTCYVDEPHCCFWNIFVHLIVKYILYFFIRKVFILLFISFKSLEFNVDGIILYTYGLFVSNILKEFLVLKIFRNSEYWILVVVQNTGSDIFVLFS